MDEAVAYWTRQRDWQPPSIDEVANAVIDDMEAGRLARGVLDFGVQQGGAS